MMKLEMTSFIFMISLSIFFTIRQDFLSKGKNRHRVKCSTYYRLDSWENCFRRSRNIR